MRLLKLVGYFFGLLVVGLGAYILYLAVLAGEFRSIEPHFDGTCRAVPGAVGPEDITIVPGGELALISADDRRATLAGHPRPGGIYAYDLTAEDAAVVNLTPDADSRFHPHGLGLHLEAPGRGQLLVVNHPRGTLDGEAPGSGPAHTIEVFDLKEGALIHRQTLSDPLLVSPNDVIPVDEHRFYVTNDHGAAAGLARTLEDYLRLPRANILYYDGSSFSVAAGGIRYANGINLSPDGSHLYVASVTGFVIYVFERDPATGALTPVDEIPVDTGPDNIEVDGQGNLWIGGHAKLLSFTAHARNPQTRAPAQVIRLAPTADGSFAEREIYLNDGAQLSGSSVAARHGDRLLIGAVLEPHFLDCRLGS